MQAHVTYQFRAYTDKAGYARIDEVLSMQRDLYNAAILERKWDRERVEKYGGMSTVTYNSQSKALTGLRAEDPEWRNQNRRLATGTLWRVEKAFQAFFRRLSAGEIPGYPRLKSPARFRTLEPRGIPTGSVKVDPASDRLHLSLKGLPRLLVPLKGRALPPPGQLKTIAVTRKGNRCLVSLGFLEEREPLPETGKAIGLDMRISIARVVTSAGNAWPAREAESASVKRLHRKIARAKMGSRNRAKVVRTLANLTFREQVRDYNEVHRFTSGIVRDHDLIAIEDLDIRAMTESARGTEDEPGENVAYAADLNRRTYAQTWGEIRRQLAYKAEWAGRKLVPVDPMDTSRTCSSCGHLRVIPQVSPLFRCRRCGTSGAAGHNAAINILRLGLALGEGGNMTLDTPQDLLSIRALAWMRV